MKTEKLSLKGIKNVLSRAEMKKIMAGSGTGCTLHCAHVGSTGMHVNDCSPNTITFYCGQDGNYTCTCP